LISSKSKSSSHICATLIEEICATKILTLDDFISAMKSIIESNQKHIYVLYRDLKIHPTTTRAQQITLDLKFSPLKIFSYSEELMEWVEE